MSPFVDPSSSTIFFFNGVFRVWKRVCYVFYPPHKPGTCLRSKHQYKLKNRVGKWTVVQKTKELGSAGGTRSCVRIARLASHTTVRGEYHGPTVVASSRCGSIASWALRFELSLGSLDLPLITYSGPIRLVLLLSWLSWPQLLAFLLKLSHKYLNLQSKLNKAKTERNRRNICINCKINAN